MHSSTGPLAIACLSIMFCCSGCASLLNAELGSLFAGVQLLLLAGFAINSGCSYVLMRLFGSR